MAAKKKKDLLRFRVAAADLAQRIVKDGAKIIEAHTRPNIAVTGPGLDELADLGHPLSASGFNPGRAQLKKEYQIIKQTGQLEAAYGTDRLQMEGDRVNTYRVITFVGFDHSGSHPSRRGSVAMFNLLSWLLDGTSKMVGRPVLINSFVEALPSLENSLRNKGLKKVRGGGTVKLVPVSKGNRGVNIQSPIIGRL